MILRRLPDGHFSEVIREWQGRPCVIIAGGPSLTQQQIAHVKAAHDAGVVKCVAVNNAYLWAPFADVHYAADSHWHKWHTEGVDVPKLGLRAHQVRDLWANFKGQKCTIDHPGAKAYPGVHVLRNASKKVNGTHAYGLSDDPRALMTGRHSGWQTLNLVILAGADPILLLGYDAQPGPNRESHWHGDHPKKQMPPQAYEDFRRSFVHGQHAIDAAHANVINCSPKTAINNFPMMPIEVALTRCSESAAVPA